MKVASNIFSIISMIYSLISAIACSTAAPQYCGLVWCYAILCWVLAICGIASSKKKVGLGVSILLFVSVLGGIFYLCWDGDE